MNWKNTWLLVGTAALLFAFIFLFERQLKPSGYVEPAKPLFANFKPTAATDLSLRHGREMFSLQRTNDLWLYRKPFAYRAADFSVQSFLETLEQVVPATRITPREMLARKQSAASFGFDPPPIAISMERAGERVDLKFGARTPAGDQVYAQVGSDPSIFVVSSELLDKVPRTPNDWRHPALFDFGATTPDRVEVGQNGTRYELRLDATNKLWKLTRPEHRADQNQVHEFLRRLQLGRVVEFVTDEVRTDDETFGLAKPEFEVALAAGANVQRIQFGKSPTNNPGLVYARLLTHSNVVLVAKSATEPLALPYTELRERPIFPFVPELVDLVEVRGDESFVLRRADGGWKAGELNADPVFVAEWLRLLAQLEANEFVQDVVTDFTKYGLEPGQRQYTLRTTVTNATSVTNVLVARLAFGTNATENKAFARRFDEDSVYGIRAFDFAHLPVAAWQFREHRVWNFSTNQVSRITVRQNGTTKEVIRQPGGEWIAVRGWSREINPFAMEEITRALGELTATMWLGKGEGVRARFGFGANPVQFSVELRAEPPKAAQTLTIEFGGSSPMRLPYALTTVDGQPMVFEFPWVLYADLQRYFELAAPRAAQ
jgi:hypothetical protein